MISYITREWIYGLLDEQPNYKLLNRFSCTLKERNCPFWSSVSLAIFQFEWLTHKKLREPGSCQHDSLHCMVDSPCEPCIDLEGNLSTSRRASEIQQSQSPSCQVLLSVLAKQKNLACLSSANPMVSTLWSGQSWSVLHVTLLLSHHWPLVLLTWWSVLPGGVFLIC